MDRNRIAAALLLAVTAALPAWTQTADAGRVAEVAKRGGEVMPFDLMATIHVFTETGDGGVQRVVARNRGDAKQVQLVRQHLQELRGQFLRGDFSGPEHIHGADMPGLIALKAAAPGSIAISYRELPDGAELTYRTQDTALVTALHRWFTAQVSDHGPDAVIGHHDEHHHHDMPAGK
jgi:hypothetical protein